LIDFDSHDVEELRSVHAHARLGFSDEMVRRIFDTCGMELSQVQTLEGGKLAVKIWLGTRLAPHDRATITTEHPKLRIVS
jgi:ArsR family transcriptional regulator